MVHRPGEVAEFTVLKRQPRSNEALTLLKSIHSLVKPIMRKHGWSLPNLSEFYPKNPSLLGVNVNRGQKICIRLRQAGDPNSFIDLQNCLIGTMLHELTHNIRGPHDDEFFKQLGKLEDEYDALQVSGYAGEGFHGTGQRLGSAAIRGRSGGLAQDREIILKRFEERERLRKLLGKGGRLGGTALNMTGKRTGDILADAAEKRRAATQSCGVVQISGPGEHGLPPDVLAEVRKAERDSRSDFIDLTKSDSDEERNAQVLPICKNSVAQKDLTSNESSSSDCEVEVIVKKRSRDDDTSVPRKNTRSSFAPDGLRD